MAKKRKAAANGESSEAKVYEVVTPVDLDNERYEPGDEIEPDEAQAAELVKCGAIKEAAAKDAG